MQGKNILLISGVIFSSCGSDSEKFDYHQFRKQLTPSGKYIIYDYARYGPMAFSSDITGTEVFEVDEVFEEGEGESINGVISEWISDDTLLVYNFRSDLDQPKDTLPIKTEYAKIADFIVKSVYLKPNSYSRGILDFDSVSTTNDSIIVQTISEKKEKKIMSFPLGGTTVQVKGDSITHVEISSRLHKSIDFVYKNPDGTYTTGLPHVGTTSYDLSPVKKLSSSLIQKKKVFWENEN